MSPVEFFYFNKVTNFHFNITDPPMYTFYAIYIYTYISCILTILARPISHFSFDHGEFYELSPYSMSYI